MVLFQKTGIVAHHNSKGEIDGELDLYINGDIVRTAHYKDGVFDGLKITYYTNGVIKTKSFYKKGNVEGFELNYYEDEKIKSKVSFKAGEREGPEITYYQNGQIEHRLFRKNDKIEGIEQGYFDDGRLMYKRNWVNNKLYGDEYFYYEDGKVKIYHTYDISGDKFYISHYDESGKRTQSDGDTFGIHTYSRDVTCDSLIVLENYKSYRTIHDFYITVANPPDSSMAVKIIINNKLAKLTFPDRNTAKVVNAFPKKGTYHISVDAAFFDKSNIPPTETHGEVIVTKSK